MLKRLRQLTIGYLQRCVISAGRRNPVKKRILSSEGQVAMVMILMAALGLVFYAVALNYNRVWEAKNTTMIAAQQSASVMASFMASYAQQISEEQIKGGKKYCDKTSVFKAIVRTVALIVLAIICSVVPGLQGFAPAMWVAVAMSVAGAAIDALVIQPSITDMWNKAMKNLSTEGYVIELGVQWGLRMSVEDTVSFPDILDFDFDGVFGWEDPARPWLLAKDGVSRFFFYYMERLRQIRTPNPSAMDEFLRQLRDFVFFREFELDPDGQLVPLTVPDVWGLHDPVDTNAYSTPPHPCSTASPPSECNQACLPTRPAACAIEGCSWQVNTDGDLVLDGEGRPLPVVCLENWRTPLPHSPSEPSCCYSPSSPPALWDSVNSRFVFDAEGAYVFVSPDPQCDYYAANITAGTCSAYLPAAAPPPDGFPFVFDPFYEDTFNSVYSLRERIGRDDESPLYRVDPANPDWHANAGHVQLLRNPAPTLTDTHDAYRVEDTSGFWQGDSQLVADVWDPAGTPPRFPGIYPFLYAIQDIGVNLSAVNSVPAPDTYSGYHCYWREDSACNMGVYRNLQHNTNIPTLLPMQSLTTPTVFPYDLAGDDTVMFLNKGGTPDIVPDPVTLFLAEDACSHIPGTVTIAGQPILSGEFEVTRGWKRGIDRFCSARYPYNTGCQKHGVDQATQTYTCVDRATGEEGDDTDEERDCFCGEDPPGLPTAADTRLFPEDFLDDLYYGIPEFLDWAAIFLSSAEGQAGYMHKTIAQWYDDEIAKWIEPPCILPPGQTCVPFCGNPACTLCGGTQDTGVCDPSHPEVIMQACCQGSVSKSATPGILYQWRDDMNWMQEQLASWLVRSSYAGSACSGTNAVWCVPGAQTANNEYGIPECPGVTANIPATATTAEILGEQQTFNVNNNAFRGDLEDVVACLGWNITNLPNFQTCLNSCNNCLSPTPSGPCTANDDCALLPRSLVEQAGIYANMTPFRPNHRLLFQNCDTAATTGTAATCNTACSLVPTAVYGMTPYQPWFCDYKFGLPVDPMAVPALADGFFDDVAVYKNTASTGSCEDSRFREWLGFSAQAAGNLRIKLQQRHTYLQYLLNEGQRIRMIFNEAVDRFDEFLNNNTPYDYYGGPATDAGRIILGSDSGTYNGKSAGTADYINPNRRRVVVWDNGVVLNDDGTPVSPRQNVYANNEVDSPAELLIALRSRDNPANKGDTSSVAVYVWQDDDIEIDGITQAGPVHAVKVEVRAPKRCNSACNADGTGPQRRWPWLKTKTKRWGTVRCYYLMDYVGRVKARVIRYDEPITNKAQRMFRFANKVPIWGMRTEHPDSVGPRGPGTIFNPGSTCYDQIHPIIRGIGEHVANSSTAAPQTLHHAFMMNDVPVFSLIGCGNPTLPAERYACCWSDVHNNMLRFGTHSESCAQYRWESIDMGVRFVPCDEGFIAGQN